jgi:PAS domain S-box-containing protein
MKILAVDDTEASLHLLRAILEAEGMTVVTARNGEEALALLEHTPVDAIISDILMPRMDGFGLCAAVRRSERFHHLPLILYTATDFNARASELAAKLGVDRFVEKPAPAKTIIAALHSITDGARSTPARILAERKYSLDKEVLSECNEVLIHKLEERNEALIKARQSSEEFLARLRIATRAGRIGIWDWNVVDNVQNWDDTICEIYGVPPGSFAGGVEDWSPHLHPDDKSRVENDLRAALRGEREYAPEFRVIWPDGSIRNVKANSQTFFDEHGKPLRMVGTNIDITENKRAEAALERERIFLEESQALGHLGSWEYRADNQKITWSAEQCRIYGIAPQTKPPSYDEMLKHYIHPDDAALLDETFGKALKNASVFELEHRIVRPDGSVRVIFNRAQPHFDAQGRLLNYIGSTLDITERKQIQLEHLQIERKLLEAQRLESLGTMAGGVAHDFNNMLAGILLATEVVKRSLPPAAPEQEPLAIAKTAALRAGNLCQQLLHYLGRGQVVRQKQSLNRLVEETMGLLKLSITKKAKLELHIDPAPMIIDCDETQIRQVIMNLVINASEAIGDKPGVIALHTRLAEPTGAPAHILGLETTLSAGPYACLEVSDTGCGMSPETQAKIFDPFFTTKFTGRGLGLSAVQGIVRTHKGGLMLVSKLGVGTTFTLFLPLVAGGVVEPAAVAPKPDATWRAHGCVLVVDDDDMIRSTTADILQYEGFEVVQAVDGLQAVELFRAEPNRFDLVLMDQTMPRMNGDKAFIEMRSIRADVRVVIISGYSEQEVSRQYRGNLPAGFLIKPFEYDRLLRTIRSALESK